MAITENHRPISVAPDNHTWHAAACDAVRRGGGTVSTLDDAEALIWLATSQARLSDHLRPSMRWVQFPSAGIEHWLGRGEIDADRIFTSARGAYNQSVAEHVVALLLAAARRIHEAARATRWEGEAIGGRMLRGSTVGILGAGGVGAEVIAYLRPFGVTSIAVTRSGRVVPEADQSFPADRTLQMLPAIDYLVLSAPATPDTTALIGAAELEAMPDHAWLINVARGTLVDTDALVTALRGGIIAGAAVDVTDPEPLPDDHALWKLPNVIITPHVANPTSARQPRLMKHVEENVRRFVRGDDLLGVVDLDRGY